MLLQILPDGKDDARKVTVFDGEEIIASFTAPTLAEAHKMLKHGLSEGWPAAETPKPKVPRAKAATKAK